MLLAAAAGLAMLGCSASSGVSHRSAPPGPPATSPVLNDTTTTVDPGTLPQTQALPAGDDPSFRSRIQGLLRAIVDGDPAEGQPAFFPRSAYVQVKAISDPVHDYQTRLIANYDQDIQALHAQATGGLGSGSSAAEAVLLSVRVPTAAQWITPGVEYNKGSYWRVYGTTVTYDIGAQAHTFEIHSLISWRGEWYVVHLGAIR